MTFTNEQTPKLGATTTAQNVSTSSVPPIATSAVVATSNLGTTNITSSTSTVQAFAIPITASSTTATSYQFKPAQPTAPSTSTSSAVTSTGFTLGGGLLNQLKGHIASNTPSTNLLGGISGDKKLGTGVPTLSSGITQGTNQQLVPQQTTSSAIQPSGSTSFLSTQAGGDKQASQMTYEELETTVNKLTEKLTDNEEEFSKIARELNEWDKAINENFEKLLLLTDTVKTVKSAQVKLTYDLDFIAVEHKDFESIISACEKEVENYNFSHPSRHDVYQKAVNIDIQVRRMCEELREVIEHLNDRLRFCESDDPVMQIGRVLNAHMESLKWVDESATQIYDYINYLSQIQEQMKKNLPQIGN